MAADQGRPFGRDEKYLVEPGNESGPMGRVGSGPPGIKWGEAPFVAVCYSHMSVSEGIVGRTAETSDADRLPFFISPCATIAFRTKVIDAEE